MSETKLLDVEQLSRMRDAHHQHGQAAHGLGDHLTHSLGNLHACTNWGGPGFDDLTLFFHQFSAHMHQFGTASTQVGDQVGTYYEGFKRAEGQMTPE